MERRFSRQRFGNRGFGDSFEKPVKMGETYDVEITEVGSRGDGIAKVKNFIIFVSDAKKGEKCKIKITQVRRRFAIGEKVSETGIEKEKEIVEEEVEEEKPKEEITEEVEKEIEEEKPEEVGEEKKEEAE